MLFELPPALAAVEALVTLSRALGLLADHVRPALDTPHPRPPLCWGRLSTDFTSQRLGRGMSADRTPGQTGSGAVPGECLAQAFGGPARRRRLAALQIKRRDG